MTSAFASSPQIPSHGGQLRRISNQFGIRAEELLDFSVNINPDGPPESVLTALRKALSDSASLTAYPDLDYFQLKQSVADHCNIPVNCVSVANGFVPLLQAALSTLRPERCLLPVPAFGEYRSSLQQASIKVTPFPLEEHGFRYDPNHLFEALHPHTRLGERCAILLANPQNPSGALTSSELMLDLVQRASKLGIIVLLDEAFIDYEPSQSLTQRAPSLPNLVVFRSVTKFFAIPSFRVAYAVSTADSADRISGAIAPWSISTLASDGVLAALSDIGFEARSREANTVRRLDLEAQLAELGLGTYASGANFLLVRLPAPSDGHQIWQDLITSERVLTRFCGNFEALSLNHLRVCVRTPQDNSHLVASLRRVIDRHSDEIRGWPSHD